LYFVFSYALLPALLDPAYLEQCTALPVGAKAIGRIPAIGRTPVGATAHPDMMGGIGATAQLEQAPAQLEMMGGIGAHPDMMEGIGATAQLEQTPAQLEKAKHGSPAQLEQANQIQDPGGLEDVC
jgi:hypothetical protein